MRKYEFRSLAVKAAVMAALLVGAYVGLVHFDMISSVVPRAMSVGN